MLTINPGLLPAVFLLFRLRYRGQARSRYDQRLTAVIVLALGVVIAPTPVGEVILSLLGRLASSISESGR
ncbi:hypothetical protein ACIP6P_19340 [Streptomyces sp. NPDC088729]|uniref:hypothetical protein n=1 Tax=Streptomyces sp. NPDC088729 TaxID=3365876 RepID=UPI00382671BA